MTYSAPVGKKDKSTQVTSKMGKELPVHTITMSSTNYARWLASSMNTESTPHFQKDSGEGVLIARLCLMTRRVFSDTMIINHFNWGELLLARFRADTDVGQRIKLLGEHVGGGRVLPTHSTHDRLLDGEPPIGVDTVEFWAESPKAEESGAVPTPQLSEVSDHGF